MCKIRLYTSNAMPMSFNVILLHAHVHNCGIDAAMNPGMMLLLLLKYASSVLTILCCAAVDTATDPKAPRVAYTLEPDVIKEKTGLAYLHSR